ncbi:zinc finger protein 426 [Zeugodacus cucurbitae]|uniref:zinc finger protein 426 n=1 Tax=Zeugodacus cucurbitae TaxID=28588 RepID=UPI0023D951B7|nr:zinc finger protein 426 [Zeugodacus cucurbitae]XP_011187115.2 zinc finger protein 426 [Zeugodacus cucurbitae]XP_011187195.2 zinc finger protein 426 [Zeugodacus cucurbitae]XP_011187269.2 zinc finger protein 426 [Zeugodacus cucurbitae]XP_011187345.2 zinc finger protein 426 [Zeugodacus cucurbitae]XP_054085076.1 zinc finger protein 426 [Zeugodacus cucurbitae]XP_054085077.1 zinc finger protein 426 [Zeugodacus cucurbitae]
MVRSRRSLSKEDGTSLLTDSGVSLSSPPAARTEHGDGEDAQDLHAVTNKKTVRRRVGGTKATKRVRKVKSVSTEATTVSKKQKIGYSADSAVSESNSAQLEDHLPAVEAQLLHAETNSAPKNESSTTSSVELVVAAEAASTDAAQSTVNETQEANDLTSIPNLSAETVNPAFIVIPAAGTTVDSFNTVDITEKPILVVTTILETSISVADSAFSETDVTQSAADLSDITHSANDSANSIGDSASASDATLTPAANKRSGKVFMRKVHICHICSKQFRGNNDLRRHMLIHSDERPYKCEQCGNCYRQAVNLRNHINCAHTNQRQFACEQCPKMFAVKERLRLHMRLHSGEKPYACPECDKRFARGGHLKQHIISHHKGSTKQYVCEKCSTAFSTPSNLRAHMDRHENGPEHYCEICKEHFPNEPVLKAHINKLHYKLGQFDCDICKETIEDDALANHMKTHTNVKTHVCEVCKSYFMQKSQYNVHMRMHTGERPYQCRICWQTYAYSSVLKLHIRKHTGEKPFQCLICTDVVAFSQLAHLKTHMKKIHKQTNPYMCEGCHQFFKIKAELQAHMQQCDSCNVDVEEENAKNSDLQTLSHLRFLMALLLKKISSQQKLQKLGYEKRLIDNVVVASLKLANRKACEDQSLTAIERMRRNVEEFLNWIVPAKAMETFRQEQQSVENILDKIVTMYMKHK